VKVQALIALKADFPLPVLLQVSGLARSTFFYHQSRLQAPDPQEALKTAVTEIFTTNHGRYGHRRIHTELLKQGWMLAKKTVLKLMRTLGLACKVRRRKRYNSYQGEQGTAAPNLLNREFDATAPNQKWVTDVTEFSVGNRKLYFSPVMDLFDRQIIAHSIGSSPNLALTNASLKQALACLEPGQQPLVHSDSETVRTGIPEGSLTRTVMHATGCWCRVRPGVLDSHSDRQLLSFPGSVSPRGVPGEAPRLAAGVT
jgi:putative transposase